MLPTPGLSQTYSQCILAAVSFEAYRSIACLRFDCCNFLDGNFSDGRLDSLINSVAQTVEAFFLTLPAC